MAEVPDTFEAYVAERDGDEVHRGVREWSRDELGEGDVTIAVDWSSVNYKDALATIPKGQVAGVSPLIPGIDLAGTVVASDAADVPVGASVLAHGYDLGMTHHGGYARLARVPHEWIVPLGEGLSARDAMVIGTAGFTAAMSVARIEAHGVTPDDGPVLVTGASGGVGSMSVDMLAGRGYEVVASSGTTAAHDWLRSLGAAEIVERIEADDDRPLRRQRWAAAVDCVGGRPLAVVLSQVARGGMVAASGIVAGMAVPTTVAPFILRAVTLAGIESSQVPIDDRRHLWARLADDLRPAQLEASRVVGLGDLEGALDDILAGDTTGRVLVDLHA